ncbi:hypothetical protein [Bacillus solimangrovi]|uniref:DUF3953 domain-containing protein n=1 Tax=Bacillus solimangrovi TaxID=1305675 RepID=A0A1E5LB75_9BACI|nr:hypothetical protein [Bacillus solimangrovi]OEH91337.1 hypothetical protein BFG57_05585 [Bacillus solimangrovi]
MRQLRFFLLIAMVILSGYSLFTGNYYVLPYTLLILALIMLVTGIIQFNKKQRAYGFLSIAIFISLIVMLIQGLVGN